MAYSDAIFREKLAKLNCTAQSIEMTSSWCCYAAPEARRIAAAWEDAFTKADQAKRLAMVYLANDIIQNR